MPKRALALDSLEKKLRRAARREKQKQENVLRAAKMHLARLAGDDASPQQTPTFSEQTNAQSYYIGCSGWYYRHWHGIFYPDTISTSTWFEHYSHQFNTVELNAPFYSWPTVATVKSWIRQAKGRPFIYTIKASELITHTKRFVRTKELVKDFSYIASLLDKHMGCFLFQLPPSYHYTPARLKTIVSQLNPAQRNVVEFRHRSWWNEKVYTAFRKAGIIFCSCSGPRLPDELIKTADDIYIRFHGTKQWYRHNYSEKELTVWKKRIQASGATRVWVYFNNDREGYAIENARLLLNMLHSA